MVDIIKVEDEYYILATSSRVDQRTRVLEDDLRRAARCGPTVL